MMKYIVVLMVKLELSIMKKFSYKLNMKMIIIITSVLVNLSNMKLMQEFLTV